MVIPNEGKILVLYWALNTDGVDLEDFGLSLFKNDYTPVDGSVFADFTKANFTGYLDVAIGRIDFDVPVIVSNVAEMTYSSVPEFECTGGSPQLVYGWYLWTMSTNKVVAAQRFDAARSMAAGATEKIDPFKVKLKTFA
jgi:hypothetical protein